MRLPSEDEINIHNSLDEISASKHFLNKTLQEAEALFQENSAYYQEDLMWMGSQAFQFYLQAVINYLKSEHSLGDDHLIDCLYEIVVFRSQQDGFLVALDRVKEMINYVIENYAKFDVDEDVYGDLLGKYRQLQSQLKE
ncbi:hypothetical protein H6F51_14230 [Cyanobacteria bacterium FACHB-DQ100]|nr:hypothetical protein [Cyanobacteria bacterium FACHB-DQ100]